MLVQDILTDALSLVGANAADEPATNSDLQLALRTANNMMGMWAAKRLLLRSTTPLDFSLTAAKRTYTIAASGADITGPKPLKILSGYYNDTGNTGTPLDIITREEYDNLQDKLVSSGPPEAVCYDPGSAQQAVQTGTFYVYLIPDKAYSVHLECDVYLTKFVNTTDTVTFDEAYYEPLVYNIAVRLFRHFHKATDQVPPDIAAIARDGMATLRSLNAERLQAGMDVPGTSIGEPNIYTGQP
jgi:hypothetical protein